MVSLMNYVGLFTYELEAGVQAFIAYRYWKAHRSEFPCFTAFSAFALLSFVAMFFLFHLASPRTYSHAYWYERTIKTAFLFLVVIEISSVPFARARRRIYAGAIGCALTICQLAHFRMWLDTSATLLLCLPLLFLMYHGDDKLPAWWIAAGFATFAITTTIVQYTFHNTQFQFAGTYCYLFAQALWIRGSMLGHGNTFRAAAV
jgi:hypothetical protein